MHFVSAFERGSQCGCGYFLNNFLYQNTCQWYFFYFLKKLFLTSAHQNDSKHTNHIKF